MPKFLEEKLKREYGEKSAVPFKVMNSIGAMKGNKETEKGREMERKHERDTMSKHNIREIRVEVHRDAKGAVTGHTVHHHMMPKATKSPAFMENTEESYPFGAGGESANGGANLGGHIMQHLGMGDKSKEAKQDGEADTEGGEYGE